MNIQCVWEHNGNDTLLYAVNIPGAYARGASKEIAMEKMGAICVEMECAAMQAMCNFRDVEFFQFLYAGDNLDHSDWDPRSLSGDARLDDKEKIALLAFELACRI